MKYLKKYDDIINENINTNEFYTILSKIKKDLGVNLYVILTFGTAIPAIYPLMEKLIKNTDITISSEQIVLLTVCAISMFIKESEQDVKKMIDRIKEDGLLDILNKITVSLENIIYLFSKISMYFGKTLLNLTDILSYVSLLIPVSIVLIEIINKFGINFTQFSDLINNPNGLLIATGIGLSSITIKQLIKSIIKKINK